MAKTYRYPVVIWQHPEGAFTARLLDDDDDGIAVAGTRKEALELLKDYLLHLQKSINYTLTNDFFSPKLRKIKVSVFPEYPDKRKTFACREAVKLNLPCVTGERDSGLLTALLPTIDYSFDFHDEDGFDDLAAHYVRSEMSGKTPRQISRFLPPANVELTELVMRFRNAKSGIAVDEIPESLGAIADHLGSRDFRKLNRTWQRESEVESLVRLLLQEGTSVCLVGATGCGKTSVLVDAARKIEVRTRSDVADAKKERLFWLTGAGRIISGMQWLGQWQKRCEDAIDDISNLGGILCVENLLELLRVGGEGPESSIAAFLMPFLQNGELRIVCEATKQELDACDRLLPGFSDCLQVVQFPPFDEETGLRLLKRAAESFERNDKIVFSSAAVASIHQLFRRFLPYAAFPGKPSAFMTGVIEKACDTESDAVTDEMVRRAFGESTGLPEKFLRDDMPLSEDESSAALSERVIGQPEPVRRIAAMLMRFKAGVNDPQRPLGAFLFCGPTGVGKTALVRALGDMLFPNKPEKERLVRLDMSEYAGADAASRLLGGRDGQPSDMIRQIRSNPFTVLLLDEVEKAAEEVFDVLLNVFEEGRLTDAFGRETSFHSTVIVMTSNLGAGSSGSMGFGADAAGSRFDGSAVRTFFRPEFLNRLDHVVPFNPLSPLDIAAVTRKELGELSKREGLAERKIELDFEEALIDHIAQSGFDPKFGARPLQRRIEEIVTAPLARWLLSNPKAADRTLRLTLENESLLIV